MPIIRDPVHNQLQGRYGVVWCPGDFEEGKEGVLAVYDKKVNPELKRLPAGWEINGNPVPIKTGSLKWCEVEIKWIMDPDSITIGDPTGAVSQFIGNNLNNISRLFEQLPLNEPRANIIYPLER
jgi:hypothetical protein